MDGRGSHAVTQKARDTAASGKLSVLPTWLAPLKTHSILLPLFLLALAGPAGAIAENTPAPALDGRLFDGASFSLAENAGKVIVLNFWATWCAPCREEMPALDAYYRRHQSEGLVVVAISMDNPKDEAKARQLMEAFAFPAAFGRELNFKGYGRIWRLPLTFVIDRQGVLRKDGWYGDPLLDSAILEQTVTPLLRARANTADTSSPRALAAAGRP
jgi:cytochrome c biogenesis protein CcmG, thiol:disulfide interchange protein DsbE